MKSKKGILFSEVSQTTSKIPWLSETYIKLEKKTSSKLKTYVTFYKILNNCILTKEIYIPNTFMIFIKFESRKNDLLY